MHRIVAILSVLLLLSPSVYAQRPRAKKKSPPKKSQPANLSDLSDTLADVPDVPIDYDMYAYPLAGESSDEKILREKIQGDERIRFQGWEFLGSTDAERYYVNKKNLRRLSSEVVKAWIQTVPRYGKRKELIERMKKGGYSFDPDLYMYEMRLYQFNCNKRTLALIATLYYGEGGSVLDSYDLAKPVEKDVVPDSTGELWLDKVCVK